MNRPVIALRPMPGYLLAALSSFTPTDLFLVAMPMGSYRSMAADPMPRDTRPVDNGSVFGVLPAGTYFYLLDLGDGERGIEGLSLLEPIGADSR